MTRWLRFFISCFLCLFRGKADPREETRIRFWTWITDADVSLINNACIVGYTEFGRWDYLYRSRLLFLLIKTGIYAPLATNHFTYLRPLRRFQRLELRTKLAYWDAKWVWISQDLYFKRRGVDTLAVQSICKATFRKGKETIPFDQVLKRVGFSLDPMPKPKHIEDLERAEVITPLDRG